jgi:hypothetical protein
MSRPQDRPSVTQGCQNLSLESLEERLVLASNYLGTPFLGAPVALSLVDPITVEAERFDNGGPGVAYVNTSPRIGITTFRPNESVDLFLGTTDGAEGQSVFNFQPGESISYTVNVPRHDDYDITFRVASAAAAGQLGGCFHLEASSLAHPDDPAVRSPLVIVPGTATILAWTNVTVRGVHLHEGINVLKLVSDFGNVAIDSFQISPATDVHIGNEASSEEHHQLEDLLPAGEATHVAIRSGNWSSPSTWSFNRVPTAGAKVWVPDGVSLLYDANSTTPIQSIRVDGTFSYSTTANTRLFVDTIGIMPRGEYVQGTASNPIGPNITSQIIFTDAGAIDRTLDPTELGRGLISHGKATIYGAEKTTQAWLQINPGAGVRTLTLATVPTGWRVGDEILIAGATSRYIDLVPTPTANTSASPQITTEDEVRIVTAINGNSVTLDRPLSYSHLPPSGLSDAAGIPLRIYVANTTRSIRYQSANVDYSNNSQIHRHGHVMFMHNDKVTVNFAEFRDLGRTNKAISIDDVLIEPVSNQQTKFTPGTGTNVRGRYSLHFHKAGINGQGSPVVARGNAIVGGPGWGLVNHQSYVEAYDNVAFNVPGAAFVEEDGTGIGSFRRNISIATRGTGRAQPFTDDGDLRDVGFAGHGFFFRGNAVIAEDNVAVGAASAGFTWMNKGDERVVVNELEIPSSSLLDPEITLGGDSLAWQAAPTKFFRRNVTVASGAGLSAHFWMQPASTQHDGRNEIRDFTGWNLIGNEGARTHYTRALTWNNVRLYRDPSLATRGGVGILAEVNATGDHVYDNVKVTGYNVGLTNKPISNNLTQRYIILDNSDFSTGNGQSVAETTSVLNIARSKVPSNPTLFFVGTAEPVREEGAINVGMYISGTKTDSLGTEDIGGRGTSTFRFFLGGEQTRDLIAKGYFQDSQGTYLIVPILITDRLTGRTAVIPIRATFDPTKYTTVPVGPNLGTYAGVNGRAYRQINAGGSASSGFTSDAGFTGGSVITTSQTISIDRVRTAAPASVYQSARVGESTYTMTGLAANTAYTVRLHFAEIQQNNVGKRQFSAKIQGQTVLENFDIYSIVGTSFKAVVREYTAITDGAGMIKIEFLRGRIGDPLVSGIEVLDQVASLVAQAPTTGPTPGSYVETEVVALTSKTPNATIYYTLNGSNPTTSSARYTKPLVITKTTTLRAIAVATGLRPSEVMEATFTIQPASTPYRINYGGSPVAGFSSDIYTTGYTKNVVNTRPINMSAAGAGPAEIYQTGTTIWAGYDMWSILPNLEAGKTYTLRLHFAEPTYTRVGDRRFDVWVNGERRLAAFDIVGEAGGRDIAVVKDLSVTADASGRIYLFMEGSSGAFNRTVMINALEVLDPNPS